MKISPNTRAMVTGANGGLGRAIARALSRQGARVVLAARRPETVEDLAKELAAEVALADLSLREDTERLAEAAREVDVLVLNAALPASGHLHEYETDQIDRALDVNLRAPIVMARAASEAMAERGRGHIVFISSISGKVATQGTSMYSATKFGLRGFSLGLREDLRPHGVGVTTIFPGFIRDAGMFANAGVDLPPGGGTRSPEDVANAVVRAVHTNPAEIDVAALEQRAGAWIAHFFPDLVNKAQRIAGGERVASQIAASQKYKR
ncbi:MAG: SDR family NAD(P)-dependent oxidoreductase [Polyangiales bacterium]